MIKWSSLGIREILQISLNYREDITDNRDQWRLREKCHHEYKWSIRERYLRYVSLLDVLCESPWFVSGTKGVYFWLLLAVCFLPYVFPYYPVINRQQLLDTGKILIMVSGTRSRNLRRITRKEKEYITEIPSVVFHTQGVFLSILLFDWGAET